MYVLLLVVIVASCFFVCCSGDAATDDGAFVETVVPPHAENKREGAEVDEGVSTQQLLSELAVTAERQTGLVAQLRTRYIGESSTIAQKDGEIARLRAQLAEAQAEVESVKAYADKVTDEKVSMLAETQHARSELQ